jgi:hypothetical protein
MRESRIISILIVIIMLSSLPVYSFSFANDINGNSSTNEYAVTFTESGLGSWPWYLNISRVAFSGPIYQSSYSVYLPNGSYAYSASASGYSTSYGSFTVNGTNKTLKIEFSMFLYSIYFIESGLPNGTIWFVNMSNGQSLSSSNNVITTSLGNGSYSFIIGCSNSTYVPSPLYGNITVNGSSITVQITFSIKEEKYYTVKFVEHGLPNGTTWFVNISGVCSCSSENNTIKINIQNGSYNYTVEKTILKGEWERYSAFKNKGIIDVQGSNVLVNVSYTIQYYIHMFEKPSNGGIIYPESGWYNGSSKINVSAIPNTNFAFVSWSGTGNGSYSGILNPVTITLKSAINETANFIELYNITFYEYGLPNGTKWYVNLSNNQTFSTTQTNLTFKEKNGTYSYSIFTLDKDFAPYPSDGKFLVSGKNINVTIKFNLVTYRVTFIQEGLPSGTLWSVTLNGNNENSTTDTITFRVTNGTFLFNISQINGFTASPSSGSITVNGENVTQLITFMPVTYKITFSESGLPSGASWSVTLNNLTKSSTNNTISFNEKNGYYSYSIETPISGASGVRYVSLVSTGTITVNRSNVIVNITYITQYYLTMISNPSNGGSVSPTSGWYNASLTIKINAIANSNFEFFSWAGTGNGSYSGSNNTTTITMSGPITEKATFIQLYKITIIETGLPSGTTWYVNLSNGQSYNTTGNSIKIQIPNGSYSYTIATINKEYFAEGGSLIVNGANLEMSIKFNLVTYAITFTESGLTSGTSWSVELDNITKSSANGTIIFNEPNGTYSYEILGISGYRANSYSGKIIVNGNSFSDSITWSIITYPITITENGIPNGTSWSATLTGTTFNGQYIDVTLSSTTNTITFNEPNGSYSYIIHLPSGYQSTSTKGPISVSGNSTLATFTAQQPTNYFLIGIIALIVIIAIVAGIFLLRRGKNKKSPREWKEQSEQEKPKQ